MALGFVKLLPMLPAALSGPTAAPFGASGLTARLWRGVHGYFTGSPPTFWVALAPALLAAALVYTRSPASNFIFDEQEALLANPYVNGHELGFLDAFRRDFWGLPPTRTIGSYRPLPNLIWWVLWRVAELPWLPHWTNIVIHAANGALVTSFVWALSRQRRLAWLSGASFLLAAVVTEAVTGVVGLADVLAGLGVLLSLHALRLPLYAMPLGVLGAGLLGLFSKESALVGVPLVGWLALVSAPLLHSRRPLAMPRALLAWTFAIGALVLYTYFRRHFFPINLPESLEQALPSGAPLHERAMHEFMRWFQQPRLPRDPINNPLVEADSARRTAGALGVYLRGLGQVIFPYSLSGDYSYAAEPVPPNVVSPKSVLGGLALVLPPLAAPVCWLVARSRQRRQLRASSVPVSEADPDRAGSFWALLAIGLLWIPVAYFPHSNIPTLLPTVRAERFWYLPVIGTSLLFALVFEWGLSRRRVPAILAVTMFLGFQALQARTHALHYTNDLAFWRAARGAEPDSAKAHLNYAVMVGARGRLEERLAAGARAIQIAPDWAMAHVYQGDTLCRLKAERGWDDKTMAEQAFPHYARGFELNPNDVNLVALALQCLYDQRGFEHVEDELLTLASRHPSSWLDYLVRDTIENGEQHRGVDPQYRPRGYNEGPKKR